MVRVQHILSRKTNQDMFLKQNNDLYKVGRVCM